MMLDMNPLREEFRTLAIAQRYFPLWTTWGIEDVSVGIHSIGLSYLTTLGQHLNFVACAEFPVTESIRADTIWWEATTRKPIAVFEFERFKDGSELLSKCKNLLQCYVAYQRSPEVLGLCIWTKQFYPLDISYLTQLQLIIRQGFSNNSGKWIPGLTGKIFYLWEFQHMPHNHSILKLNQIYERDV